MAVLLINAFFNNTSLAGQQFIWDFGDGTTSTEVNPTHLYADTGSLCCSLTGPGQRNL